MVWIRRCATPSENHGKMDTKDSGHRVILITSMLYFVTSNMWIGNFFVISNQYLNLILVVYDSMWTLSENHFVISNQYLNLILNCFGCQKNKTNSLLTSSQGNGFLRKAKKE